MNLELKHLAPYLPYELGMVITWKRGSKEWKRKGVLKPENISFCARNGWKPILRPLSDLTKEIEHNGQNFVPLKTNVFDKNDLIRIKKALKSLRGYTAIRELPYCIIQNLLFWHFDIYGLIDSGLAIDINTIDTTLK